MDVWKELATEVLRQLGKGLEELSVDDYERLVNGRLRVSVSFVKAPRRQKPPAPPPAAEEAFADVQARLAAAGSREEGRGIVEEAFAAKERLFAFARYLDLPVQRSDAARRIRDKVVTHTVGRRLGGRAVRGDGAVRAWSAMLMRCS